MLGLRRHNRQGGFTLIELLIVIAILGILAIVLLTIINPVAQIQKANDARRKSDLAQVQKVLEAYYSDNGSYPQSGSIPFLINSAGAPAGGWPWGSVWTPYNTTLPKDPGSTRKYIYWSDGQSYALYSSLERGSQDPQACPGVRCPGVTTARFPGIIGTQYACGGQNAPPAIQCQYGVTSPNISP